MTDWVCCLYSVSEIWRARCSSRRVKMHTPAFPLIISPKKYCCRNLNDSTTESIGPSFQLFKSFINQLNPSLWFEVTPFSGWTHTQNKKDRKIERDERQRQRQLLKTIDIIYIFIMYITDRFYLWPSATQYRFSASVFGWKTYTSPPFGKNGISWLCSL